MENHDGGDGSVSPLTALSLGGSREPRAKEDIEAMK